MVVGIIYRYISPSGKSYIGQTTKQQVDLFGNIKIINYDVETNNIYVS